MKNPVMFRWRKGGGITKNLPYMPFSWSLTKPTEVPHQFNNPSTAPPTATFEESIYVGIIVLSILYGVYYILFLLTVYFLKTNTQITAGQRRFFWVFSFTLVLLNTIGVIGIIRDGQMMWIVHRDNPGGPIAYYYNSRNHWWIVLSQSSQVSASFLAGLLLIYRCYMMFERNIWIILFPLLCAFSSLSLFIVAQVLFLQGTIKTGYLGSSLGAAMFFTTVGMNTIVAAMICGRLIMAYRHQKETMDRSSLQLYPTIIAILLESSTPFCVLGTTTCVLYSIDTQYELVIALLWYGASVIFGFSPQLIILRMAISDHTHDENQIEQLSLSTLEFTSHRHGHGRPDRTIMDGSAVLEAQNSLRGTGTSRFSVEATISHMQLERMNVPFDIRYSAPV